MHWLQLNIFRNHYNSIYPYTQVICSWSVDLMFKTKLRLRVQKLNKANLRDLIAATGLVISNWIQIVDFSACVTLKFDGWPQKTIGHIFYTMSSFVNHFKSIGEFKLELQSWNAQLGSILAIFFLCDLEIWWITLENNRAPFLYYIKLCASFQFHCWSKTWVTVRKRPIPVKIGDFFVTRDLKIWWMTLKNNRAPLLYYIKLCASFQSHGWIQTGVTVQKHSIRVESGNFLSCVTLNFDRWAWKTIGHLSCSASSFVYHFIAIGEFKLELQWGHSQIGSKSMIFLAVWPWNLTYEVEKQ